MLKILESIAETNSLVGKELDQLRQDLIEEDKRARQQYEELQKCFSDVRAVIDAILESV